jgi:8-oxo-dGTP diphosphatase
MKSHTVVNFLVIKNGAALLENAKLGMWAIPGGHVEENESPIDAVRREAKEELSLDVDFPKSYQLFDDKSWVHCLPVPVSSFEHIVEGDNILRERHANIVLVYVVLPLNEPVAREGQSIRWFSKEDLLQADIHPVVREVVLHGLRTEK